MLFGAALSTSAMASDGSGTVSAIGLSRAQPAATAALLRGVPEAPAVRKSSADYARLAADMNQLGPRTRVGDGPSADRGEAGRAAAAGR